MSIGATFMKCDSETAGRDFPFYLNCVVFGYNFITLFVILFSFQETNGSVS